MPPVTVLIAHGRKATRTSCLRLLQRERRIRVVGEAKNSLEAMTAVARFKPRILLLHLNLIKGKGIVLLPVLHRKSPRARIILITHRASQSRILDALSHGAQGYLEEKAIATFLPKAVRCVDAGEAWVPRKMVAKVLNRLARLAAREKS